MFISLILVAAACQPPHAPVQLVGWESNQLHTSISGCLSSESLSFSCSFISFSVTFPNLVFFSSSLCLHFLFEAGFWSPEWNDTHVHHI